jgi:hypothetical protein
MWSDSTVVFDDFHELHRISYFVRKCSICIGSSTHARKVYHYLPLFLVQNLFLLVNIFNNEV